MTTSLHGASAQRSVRLAVAGLASLWCAAALASLGGGAESAVSDQSLRVVRSTDFTSYEIRETMTNSAMVLREYLNRSRIVFAVAWQGPAQPDLSHLLGSQYEIYARALLQLQRPGLHRSLRIEAPGLLVESAGHLRFYVGRAVLTNQVPDGVSLSDLR